MDEYKSRNSEVGYNYTLLSENSDNKSSKVVLGYLCNILNECYPEDNILC